MAVMDVTVLGCVEKASSVPRRGSLESRARDIVIQTRTR